MPAFEIVEKETQGCLYITQNNSILIGNKIVHNLDEEIEFNRVMLETCSFMQTFYNVFSEYGNNEFSYSYNNGAIQTFVIPDNFYTSTELIAYIIAQLNLNAGLITTSTFVNSKLKIGINNGKSLRFVAFNTASANEIYKMLGLRTTDAVFSVDQTVEILAPDFVNVQLIQTLLLDCDQIKPVYQIENRSVSFSVMIDSEFGHTETYEKRIDFFANEVEQLDSQFKSLGELTFTLYNEELRTMRLPENWTYCFKFIFIK